MTGRHHSVVFGVKVDSPVALCWTDPLAVADPTAAPVTIEAVDTSTTPSMRGTSLAPEEEQCRLERLSDATLLADSVDAGPFLLHAGRSRIDAPIDTIHDEEWEHRLLAYALPYLLGDQGHVVLHGAAVEVGDRTVLLLGPSGRGKSTLTMAAIRAGFRVLGDDAVRVAWTEGTPIAWPGAASTRVVRRDASGRRRGKETFDLPAAVRCRDPRPIAGIVALRERSAEGAPLRRLGPRDRVGALLQSTFADRRADAAVYRSVVRLAGEVPIASISVRDDVHEVDRELARALRVCDASPSPRSNAAGHGEIAAVMTRRKEVFA